MYRICNKCHRDWNVSKLEPRTPVYICPECERQEDGCNATHIKPMA